MTPILFTTAASVAGDIIHNIAERIANGTAKNAPTAAPAVPFSTLVDQASAPTAATLARRAQELSTRLGRSAEVAAAANEAGVAGPLNIQIDAKGDAALRLPDGGLKPIHLSEELRGVARELNQLRQPGANGAHGATAARPAGPVTISVA
ncbi:MAG: hypothetical protein QOE70_5940 [Chthoniobacter sp.]|jgi:hypothetical protein|nr:hypothetical protein [Chthoniobacter sp.]